MFKKYNFIIILIVFTALLVACYVYLRQQKENETPSPAEKKTTKQTSKIDVAEPLDFFLPGNRRHQIIQHQFFTLSYNEQHEQAAWVAYKLFPYKLDKNIKRKNDFRKDAAVLTGSATLKDYKKSGYDRGHLAPAKTLSFSEEAMSESFLMSNMSPQKPSFNRGIWKRLENKVRDWLLLSDSLYVVTGPVLQNTIDVIGANKVSVPRAYYKSMVRFKNKKMTGIGFLLNHEKSAADINTFVLAIDSIEQITNLNFFKNLDTILQNKIEKNTNLHRFITLE
jgi:endonuclease G|tara:strand:+ start:137 stop:976 length:840 start_codon:yes stop_codon:yes gene_type:complete